MDKINASRYVAIHFLRFWKSATTATHSWLIAAMVANSLVLTHVQTVTKDDAMHAQKDGN